MASSFLKRKAEQRAKKADERYGAASYGGSASLRPSAAVPERVTNGGGNGAPVTRASNFLTKKAAERAGAIDQQFGTSAYGGSDWTVLDKEQGFNRWLEDMNDFSRRMSGDFAGREGAYQSKQSMDKYRSEAENNMEVMRGRANIYRSYFENNRDLYGDEAVESVLSALNQGEKYMGDLKGGLDSEYDFWSQFEDEKDYDHYKRGKEYAALSDAADFAEKSRYVSTYQPGTEKFNAWTGTYSNSGFGDINYDYINRNQTARDRQMLADIQSNASLLGLDSSERGEMTDDEIAIFNYIYATESPEAAYEYIDYLTSDLNYRQRAKAEEEWAAYAKEHPVGSSVFSVVESPLKGLSYLGQFADYTADGEIDQNEGYNKFSYINSAIRSQVNDIVEQNWGGVGSFAYQTGMSMGDFLFNTAITGGNSALTLGIMGTGAAADTTIAAKDRGLSDDQAFALGTIAGAAEIVTEKVSLDALLDTTSLGKNAMGYLLKNTLAEGSEEVGSDLINLVADVLIAKDKSEWQQSIAAYQEAGMDEKSAFRRALLDQVEMMGLDFLGGAISGGAMSGAGIGINAGLNEYSAQQTGKDFAAMGDDVVLATIQEGLASDPSTRSYQLAQQLQQKLDAGETVTNAELGRLYQANVRAIDAEENSDDLLLRAADEVARKGGVTNSTATDILGNPSAVRTLAQDAGLSLADDMSKAQRRKAVKTAVETLASRNTATMESSVETNMEQAAPSPAAPQSVPVQQRPMAAQAYDIRRVQSAAASLGERGAKALRTAYDGSVSADTFYAGFASYYEAGVSGMDMGKVRSEYGAQLSAAQKYAAYVAGRNDAELSLQRERQAAPYAKSAGNDSGLVYDDFVRQAVESGRVMNDVNGETRVYLTAETAAKINGVAKSLGVRVQFVDSVRGGTANAQISGSTVLVERNNHNPVMAIVGHEMTHRMQELAPKEYRAFRDFVAQEEQSGIQRRIDAYAAQGVELTYEQAMDEVAADYAGRMIDDGKVLDDFIEKHRDDRTLLEKVRDAIRAIVRKLTGAEKKQAQTAEGKLTAALEASAKQANALQNGGSVVGTEGGYAKVNGKFSLKGVVEDNGELLALHNLTEKNLLDALELGGLPMPSIAVVRAETGHTKYGDISLVLDKSSIDPQADWRNKVYGGDAWTPTAPKIEYEPTKQAEDRLRDKYYDLARRIGYDKARPLYNYATDLEEELNRNGGEQAIIEKHLDDTSMMNLYLADTGRDMVEDIYKEIVHRIDDATREQYDFIINALGEGAINELRPIGDESPATARKRWLANHGETLENAYRDYLRREGAEESEIENAMESPSFSASALVRDVVLRARNYMRTGPETRRTEYDAEATRAAIMEAVDQASYREWLNETFSGLVKRTGIYNGKEIFNRRGNRRSWGELHNAYTLENIVNAMRNVQEERGQGAWGVGATTLQAVAAPSYKSIQEMKGDSGKLGAVDGDEYTAAVEAVDAQIDGIIQKIKSTNKSHSDNSFVESDNIATALKETAKGRKTIDAIMRSFAEYGYKISNQTAKDIQMLYKAASDLPTEYFEAKPQRAVGFDEVLAAIIPDDSSEKLRTGLEQAGVRTLEYKSGDDTDRLAKVNSVEGARFSLKTDSQGRTLTEQQREYFKDSKAVDGQGRLLVLYHGTGAKFTVFDKTRIGENFSDRGSDLGFYFSPYVEDANGYAREAAGYQGNGEVMQVYLNLKNPLVIEDEGWGSAIGQADIRHGDLKRWAQDGGHDGIIVKSTDIEMDDDGTPDAVYIAFSPNQIKSTDNKAPTSDPDIRYSLKSVPPVRPKSKDWRPGATFDEVKAAHPTLFALDADEADTRNPTQISGTVKSYRKIYDALKAEGFDGTILDASSGLGYGTRAGREEYGFQVDDIEPFPDEKYKPMFTDYSTLEKTYDVIISNAVLNVMPQDLRDAMVVKIGEMLNPGGRAFINVRGTDVKNAGSKVAINDNLMEYFISNTGSYQKGFTSKELVSYLKDALGDGFTVEPTRKFGAVSAIVTRYATDRYSLKAGTEGKSAAALQEENELLREQMKDYIDLQRRNGKLQESRDYWQGQTRRTKRVTTDKKAVSRAARELIRSYGADLDAGDITQDLQSLYDYLASGYDGKDELTYTEARRRAEAIAEKLVGNAVAVDETYEQYSDLRAYLRSTTLSLSEEDSRDIPDYGDWRKHQMGRMVIRKGHTNIDQVYQEMSELWPEFFDEQRENNPVDQLLRIAEVMDGIYNVEEYNPFGPYMQQAITGAANEIMERFFDLPQTRATFADRQARKLDDTKAKGRERVQKVREQNAARLAELRQQNRERTTKAVERERTRRAEQIGKLKQRYREKDAAGRERRSARELRAKIMRHASALSQKLLRPSDKQHIPESLRQAVAVMLESINLESAYTTDPNTGKRVKDGSGTPTKRTEAFRALRLAYAEITKDGGDYTLIIDPDLMDNLNELESMKNTPIAEMGTDQLSTVWATLKAVEASIRTANKMLGTSRFETISGFADGIRSDNILRQDRGDYRGVAGKVDRLVNLDMLTPQGYFHRLGKTGEELFRMMRAAQDRHITIMQQAQEKTAEIVGRADVNKLEREKHTFELSGGKVTMSTAQIMGLYELMKRKQAQDHILKGGIRPDTISSGRGLREDRPSAPVKVSVDDLATITGTLTEEQIRIADGLQKFMGGKLAELGNEASMTVYGYRKFTEKDYYPIKVDKNQTKRDISKEAQAATIAGRGFTKSVTPKANNAVMVESIFDTYSSHVNDMATYAAWLPTMENIRRIRDFTFRDGEGNRTGDVKSIIERVFGKNGNAYLNKLVDDINQGVRPNGTGNFTDALVGNYKAAAVAANIRVILQQPTAILRAMGSLDPKYLLAGTAKRGDWAKVKKYAPIAVWKDWGYFDINTGRQMKDVLLSSDSLMEKVKQAAMAGAGKADSFAWARLWNAAEAETRDKRPGLKPGTEAFYQAVGARFSEIVDQTQVVDGLLQRSQIMRSPDALTKMATSFMAEPTKTYNMFVNAVYDLRHATGKDGRSNAKRALARTSAALVVSFAVNAVMQSIVDALRDDDKERDYWEKFLTAYTGFTGEEETALDYWNSFWDGNLEANFNPAGYIPYFKDLVSIMQGYDVSRMDMEPVSKVLEAASNMKKALSGEGKYSVAGASANLLAEVSRLLGIPVANLKRDIQAGITTAAIETDNYLMQYRIDKSLLNMGYQGNTKNFYDILYNASINDREAYETIYADMVASGMPEDKIRNAMESRMKRDQGVESVGDLELRYLSPSQERRYNSTRNSMAGSSVWTAASRDQQEAAEKDLYDLTVGNDSGEKLQEKIAAGAAYGISEADYLLYRLALHVADQPTENGNLGSYTGEEVQTAIDMLPGLDDEARAYLWEAAGKSEKSNPYK